MICLEEEPTRCNATDEFGHLEDMPPNITVGRFVEKFIEQGLRKFCFGSGTQRLTASKQLMKLDAAICNFFANCECSGPNFD